MSSVAATALQCFSALSNKRHDFRGGGGLLNTKAFLFSLHILSKTFLILTVTEQDILVINQLNAQILVL